ncbi:MAG TPA: hypothetical protein VI423_11090 [Paenisporosarcina sp.]|nr:hypothetical protein [Paenisporosarcina sp.]
MSNDKVIKNPGRKVGPVERQVYVPEWVRLGREPIVQETNPRDFTMVGSKKNPPQRSLSTLSEAQAPIQLPNKAMAHVVSTPPQQTKVTVGMSKNWFDASDNHEVTDEILYDEVPDPPIEAEVDDQDKPSEHLQLIGGIEAGSYGIIVRGVLAAKADSAKEAEAIVESILFDGLPNFSGVLLEDIIVMKRIPLKVGVLTVE